jgi:hypothetical protein
MQNTHNFPSMGARSLALWPLSRAIKETSQSKRKKKKPGLVVPSATPAGRRPALPAVAQKRPRNGPTPQHHTAHRWARPLASPGKQGQGGGCQACSPRGRGNRLFSPLPTLLARARERGARSSPTTPLLPPYSLFARFRFSFSFSAFFSAWFSSQPGSRSAACDAVTGSARELRGSGHLAVTAKKKKTHGRLTCGPRCSSRPPPRGVVSSCRWLMTPAARLRDGFECVLPVLHTTPYLTNFFFQIANTFFFSNSIIFS